MGPEKIIKSILCNFYKQFNRTLLRFDDLVCYHHQANKIIYHMVTNQTIKIKCRSVKNKPHIATSIFKLNARSNVTFIFNCSTFYFNCLTTYHGIYYLFYSKRVI